MTEVILKILSYNFNRCFSVHFDKYKTIFVCVLRAARRVTAVTRRTALNTHCVQTDTHIATAYQQF